MIRLSNAQRQTLRMIHDGDAAWKVRKIDGSTLCAVEVNGKTYRVREPTCRALYLRDLIDIGAVMRGTTPVMGMTITNAGREALGEEAVS